MIVQNQVMYVFDILLGTWQIQAGLLAGQVLSYIILPTFINGLDRDQNEQINLDRLIVMCVQGSAIFYLFISKMPLPACPYLVAGLSVFIPMLSTIMFSRIFVITYEMTNQLNEGEIDVTEQTRTELMQLLNSLLMNNCAYIATLVVCLMYTNLRSCFKTRMQPEIFNADTHLEPSLETLEAHRSLLDLFLNAMMPGVCMHLLQVFTRAQTPGYWQVVQVQIIIATGYINGSIFLLIVFIDYKKGGKWWTKIAPNLYLALIWISYLLLPWVNLTFLVYTVYDGSLSTKLDEYIWIIWCVGCNVIYCSNFIEYTLLVHKTIVFQINAFKKIRKEIEVYRGEKSNDEIQDMIVARIKGDATLSAYLLKCLYRGYETKSLPYINKLRGFGEGEVRIGDSVEVQGDVYSQTFNSMLTTRHIMMFMDPDSGDLVSAQDQQNLIKYFFTGDQEKLTEVIQNFDESFKVAINDEEDDQDNSATEEEKKSPTAEESKEKSDSQLITEEKQSEADAFAKTLNDSIHQDYTMLRAVDKKGNLDESVHVGEKLYYNGQLITPKMLDQKEKTVMLSRMAFYNQMFLCMMIQFLELGLIGIQVVLQDWDRVVTLEISSLSLFLRLFLALMLHFSLMDDVRGALDHMKFAVNHPYLFYSSNVATLACMIKFTTAISTEFLNILYLMSTFSSLSLIQNFITMQVIAYFPYVMNASVESTISNLSNESICDSVFVVCHTTSVNCQYDEKSTSLDDNGDAYPLRVQNRTCGNRILFIIYKISKYLYINLYFYYTTPMVMLLSLYLPLLFGDGATNDGIQTS